MNQHLSFEEAYPELEDILVQSKPSEDLDPQAVYGSQVSLKATWSNWGTSMGCRKTDCQSSDGNDRGVFDLGEYIRKTLEKPEGHGEYFIRCNGFKGSTRTSHRPPPCRNSLWFRIQVKRKTP